MIVEFCGVIAKSWRSASMMSQRTRLGGSVGGWSCEVMEREDRDVRNPVEKM